MFFKEPSQCLCAISVPFWVVKDDKKTGFLANKSPSHSTLQTTIRIWWPGCVSLVRLSLTSMFFYCKIYFILEGWQPNTSYISHTEWNQKNILAYPILYIKILECLPGGLYIQWVTYLSAYVWCVSVMVMVTVMMITWDTETGAPQPLSITGVINV